MLDWLELVKSRLGSLGLDPDREGEIVAELAAHLEQLYEDMQERGLAKEESARQSLASVSDWSECRHDIRLAEEREGAMNQRTRSIWLPGLTTLTLAYGFAYVMMRAGIYPVFIGSNPHESLVLYIPWLLFLPVAAGIGAFWSKRAGGGRLARLVAGLFPVLMISAIFTVILPLALILDRPVPPAMQLKAFAFALLNGVLVPGVALLLGTLPFFKSNSGKPANGTSRAVVSEKGKDSTSTNHFMLFLGLSTRRRVMDHA